jgi:hypothetical protein
VELFLESQNEDVNEKLPFEQIVSEAQEASTEYKQLLGLSPEDGIQPNAQFNISLALNEAGTYSVSIDPLVYDENQAGGGPLQVPPKE